MAKTNPQAEEPRKTQDAASPAKKAKRPSKKQATKKPAKKQTTKKTAKKPAKKTAAKSSASRVTKKQATKKPAKKQTTKKTAKKPAKKTAAKSPASRVAKKQTTKKPAKKQVAKKATKKPAKKTTAESPASRVTKKQATKKPAKKIETPATQEERTVISSPPSTQREQAEVAQTPQDAQTEDMQWGRRTKRSAPIGWEDHAGISTPVQPTRRQDANAESQPVEASAEPVETPPQARNETPARPAQDKPKKEVAPQPPKQAPSAQRENRSEKPDQPSRKLTQILAQSWTEAKTRQFISEGFLGSLSPELVGSEKRESIPDAEMLKKPLQMIRKVLADECMVADDVTDLILLDVVMNALSDRIDVYRLQAESNSPADIDMILELRYKADRRLIEALNALKNA